MEKTAILQNAKSPRLMSLDALRGFDMLWIVCGEGIFHGLASVVKAKYGLVQSKVDWQIATDDRLGFWDQFVVTISNQLHHSVWNGFAFYDLIFPLFIFIAGISMPFSFGKQLSQPTINVSVAKKNIYRSLIKRTILLIVLGMVVNGLLQWKGYEQTRFASVLGRIGLSCFFAAVIYLNSSFRWRIAWIGMILVAYWMALMWIPVPGFGAGVLTPEGNLSAWVDRVFLPGKLHRGVYDPEGLLSTIPAIASGLLGVFTGEFLMLPQFSKQRKAVTMLLVGLGLLLLGWLWGLIFPINKTMWTSSFVLFAGGWSLLLMAVFYAVLDVWEFKKWSLPLVWLGANSILIYLAAHGVVNFLSTSEFLFGGLLQFFSPEYKDALLWIGVMLIQFASLRFLYKKNIFLKL